jgi:hypothetical protein
MNKKAIERFFVEWFIDKIGWDSCRVVDDEGPDFKIIFPDRIFGLEVTSLFRDENRKGSPIKRNESIRGKWLSEVSEKYYEKSQLPLSVKILIKSGKLECDPNALAHELAQRSNLEIYEKTEFEFTAAANCKLKMWIVRLPDKFKRCNLWTFIDNHIGFSREIDEAVILNKVKKKAAKLPKYKERYSKIVLLIVLDRTYESGMFHQITEELVLPDCGFSSVYLALYPENYIKIY